MARWGRNTVVKFVGAELAIRDDANLMHRAGRVFEAMYYRGRDLSPVLGQQRPRFQDMSRFMFARAGWPTSWRPLEPGYAAWKAKHFPGKPIMRRSDRLYLSLVSETPDSVWRVSKQSIQFGTRVPYWRDHQFGNPTLRLPARPTVGLDPYTLSFIGDDIVRWIIASDSAAGRIGHLGVGGRVAALLKRALGGAEKYVEFVVRRF